MFEVEKNVERSFLGKAGHSSRNYFGVNQIWAWILTVLDDLRHIIYLLWASAFFSVKWGYWLLSQAIAIGKMNPKVSIMMCDTYKTTNKFWFLFFLLILSVMVFNNMAPVKSFILLMFIEHLLCSHKHINLDSGVTEISKAGALLSNIV